MTMKCHQQTIAKLPRLPVMSFIFNKNKKGPSTAALTRPESNNDHLNNV